MKRLWKWMVLGAAAGLLPTGGGCEERPEVPQAVLDATTKPPEPTFERPTTQALLSGHRTRSPLTPLPLTMEVPESWTQGEFEGVKNPGHLLQGYTPNGVVQIDLASRPGITQERLDQILEGARKEAAKDTSKTVALRPLGDLKILERQQVLPAKELTTYTVSGSSMVPQTNVESIFKWSVMVLVPFEGAFQAYELNFLGLTKSQYDKDKEFLESILSTIQYAGGTGSGGGGGSTAPAAP